MSDVKEVTMAEEPENVNKNGPRCRLVCANSCLQETFEDANDETTTSSATQQGAGAPEASEDQDNTSKRQSQADSAKALDDEEKEALKNAEEVARPGDATHTRGNSSASIDRAANTDTTSPQGNQGG